MNSSYYILSESNKINVEATGKTYPVLSFRNTYNFFYNGSSDSYPKLRKWIIKILNKVLQYFYVSFYWKFWAFLPTLFDFISVCTIVISKSLNLLFRKTWACLPLWQYVNSMNLKINITFVYLCIVFILFFSTSFLKTHFFFEAFIFSISLENFEWLIFFLVHFFSSNFAGNIFIRVFFFLASRWRQPCLRVLQLHHRVYHSQSSSIALYPYTSCFYCLAPVTSLFWLL